jgi:hypothetical protein
MDAERLVTKLGPQKFGRLEPLEKDEWPAR